MSLVLRRCIKANTGIWTSGNSALPGTSLLTVYRSYCDDKLINESLFSHSTIFVENGLNVHELPLIIRKLKDVPDTDEKSAPEQVKASSESNNYTLIQDEFKQCLHLRHVFSLLSKCTKITPNIALGAIERICDLEKNPPPNPMNLPEDTININLAKGAILDKLLKVVMKTEDTQTILNILDSGSAFMDPYKPTFCDELLLRIIDNKLTIPQLCQFMEFLIKNKSDLKYSETIDKLWVGFLERENDINEKNIVQIFQVLNGFKLSKRSILTLLEQKLSELWTKINVSDMQSILHVFDQQKYVSVQSFAVVSSWLYTNIHAVDQDSMLDIITKLTRLQYSDCHVERSVEKYMKLKISKIETPIVVIGILNYCMQFKIRNIQILNACNDYFLTNAKNVPNGFLKSIIYPFGYMCFDSEKSAEFWSLVENILVEKFYKINTDDLCSITLASIYCGKYPLKLVNKLLSPEYLVNVNNPITMKKLNLIDTSLSLECADYSGPLLPKDQCSKNVSQDSRIKKIIEKTRYIFEIVAGGPEKLSVAVMVPNISSDDIYLLDLMIHPTGMVGNTFDWKSKLRNENVAILIHLPDHYCSDGEQLVGPQVMRRKHLKILGLKVVSLKYAVLSQFYTSCNNNGLRQYILGSMNNAEECSHV